MSEFIEIAVNVPQIKESFHYRTPTSLAAEIKVGHLVEVPFGRQQVQGVVLGFVSQPAVREIREVVRLLDPDPVLTPLQIALARELAHEALAPLSDCIGLMLPPGLGQQADTLYQISRRHSAASDRPLTNTQKRLIGILNKRGALRGRQIDQALPRINWRSSAQALMRRGLLTSEPVLLAPSVRPKYVRTAQLACAPEEAESRQDELGRAGSPALKRRQALLRALLRESGPVEAAWLYAESGSNLSDLRRLSALGLVVLGESEVWRDPLEPFEFRPSHPPTLTQDQQKCWQEIRIGLQEAAAGRKALPYLLHGVTGSGKTEIYLHAVEQTLRLGRQAIVLVPEIALTPQTAGRFLSRFPGQVGLMHSRLSQGERYDTWRRARAGELSVIVGPRSALFAPLSNPGLIVIDECHDDSYYQNEPPFYHARDAALIYARLGKAVCLLGSATPEVTSVHQAAQGSWHYLHLPARILAHRQAVQAQVQKLGLKSRYRPLEEEAETMELPPVEVADMRQELQAGNRSIFSRSLQIEMANVLQNSQQAILFLNRRGTATYVFCRDCGYALRCPNCDLPLTFHSPQSDLQCHHCGYHRKMPAKCPQCGSQRIRQYGTGTERVEAEVQAMFPQARTLRWDYESTRKKGAHDVILNHFRSQRADVLIGTQMIAKGLDLPMVTLVGVVLADVGLNFPDYSAAERAFQILTQVAGRAGRSPLGGKVVLQTFQPEHYVIQAAARHNYRSFYQQELEYRRQLGYPPFTHLVRLEYRNADLLRAEAVARQMAEQVQSWIERGGYRATDLIGPVPCFFARLAGLYRWQVVLRGPDPVSLLRGRALGEWRVEVNPPSLL